MPVPLQPIQLDFSQDIFPATNSNPKIPPQGQKLLPNPPYEINQNQVTQVERDVKLVECNSSCKIPLQRYFRNLPEADILASNEIGRERDVFEEAARRAQWIPVVVAECKRPNGNQIARSAVLIRAKSIIHSTKSQTYLSSCYADLIIKDKHLRVISVYVPCNGDADEMIQMGEWIKRVAYESKEEFIIVGDFNGRTTPTVERCLRRTGFRELVQMRSTFRRKNARTSLDRVFIPPKAPITVDKILFTESSDHATITVSIKASLAYKLPPMSFPPKNFQSDATNFQEIVGAFESNTCRARARPRSTKIKRWEKGIQSRLLKRKNCTDHQEIMTLNNEIKAIRKKIDMYHDDIHKDMASKRLPYNPPHVSDPGSFYNHYRERYNGHDYSHPAAECGSFEEVSSEEVSKAIASMKKNARTTDWSANFLTALKPTQTEAIAREFCSWIRQGIPFRYAVAWIFLVWKPGRRHRHSPKSYRPIAILSLWLKLLHYVYYNKLKAVITKHVRQYDFQYGSGRKSGVAQIHSRAQQWLDGNYDKGVKDEHVVVMADIKAAYDSVSHAMVVQKV